MWEEAVRVPLIIRDPRFVSRTVDALVELIDLVPTILGDPASTSHARATREEPNEPVTGRRGSPSRSCLFRVSRRSPGHGAQPAMEVCDHERKARPGPRIRHRDWALQVASNPSTDLHEDPGESHNLAVESEFSEVLSDMRSRMLETFQNTHPNAAAMPPGLSILEKLEWFLEPPER